MFGKASDLKQDLSASLVVFLVALPLCLGIALASDAPLFSGLIAGVVGGIVVGRLSQSPIGVSGPAAGLAVIVATAIHQLGSFEAFLVAVVISGFLQLLMGFIRAGVVAYYFPTAVINGMLAGIGAIIIMKQLPFGFGIGGHLDLPNNRGELFRMLSLMSPGPVLIASVCLAVLIIWELPWLKRHPFFRLVQGPLVAVFIGVFLNQWLSGLPTFQLQAYHMVQIPELSGITSVFGEMVFPDWSALGNKKVYMAAGTLALVGSLETLICLEAVDKQDPKKRRTPANRELTSQGVANIILGLIGGLPVIKEIVRSSVNIQAGAQSRNSVIFHGFFIFIVMSYFSHWINKIPLASLAAILVVVGYKLTRPSLYTESYRKGREQFLPFIATVLGTVFIDLLIGVLIGISIAVFFILQQNYKIPVLVEADKPGNKKITLRFGEDVSFLKKASIQKLLHQIPNQSHLIIDASNTYYIHRDVIDVIEDFFVTAEGRGIQVELKNVYENKSENPVIHFSQNS